MLQKAFLLLARRKHGQRVWNPHTSSQGAAPASGITALEALQIAYRPLPLPQTVEYEEDFGSNLMIHREFISKKNRELMDFQISGLAYSDTELHRGRQHFAGLMNQERAGAVVGASGNTADRVNLSVSQDPASDGIQSARYLFDENRLQYCERFQRFFEDARKKSAMASSQGAALSAGVEGAPPLFSLMEVCAIVYGCDTREAQEAYLHMFMGLSTDCLEEDEQRHRRVPTPHAGPSHDAAPFPSLTDTLPSLFEDVQPPSPLSSDILPGEGLKGHQTAPSKAFSSAGVYSTAEHAANTAHASGVAPMGTYDVSHVPHATRLTERRRWRSLIEKLVSEEYSVLTPEDYGDALVLNNQLHTAKFLDLKVGEAIKDILSYLQRDPNAASSVHSATPATSSPHHPGSRTQPE